MYHFWIRIKWFRPVCCKQSEAQLIHLFETQLHMKAQNKKKKNIETQNKIWFFSSNSTLRSPYSLYIWNEKHDINSVLFSFYLSINSIWLLLVGLHQTEKICVFQCSVHRPKTSEQLKKKCIFMHDFCFYFSILPRARIAITSLFSLLASYIASWLLYATHGVQLYAQCTSYRLSIWLALSWSHFFLIFLRFDLFHFFFVRLNWLHRLEMPYIITIYSM